MDAVVIGVIIAVVGTILVGVYGVYFYITKVNGPVDSE